VYAQYHACFVRGAMTAVMLTRRSPG
jgi:hypothetical protein